MAGWHLGYYYRLASTGLRNELELLLSSFMSLYILPQVYPSKSVRDQAFKLSMSKKEEEFEESLDNLCIWFNLNIQYSIFDMYPHL